VHIASNKTQKSDDRPTAPGWNLSDGSVDAAKRRLHDVATAAHAWGADARYTFALTKSAYARLDAAGPAEVSQIVALAEKVLDVLVPSISFDRSVAKAGVTTPVPAADQFWTVEVDPTDSDHVTYRFALDLWLRACAAAGAAAGTAGGR
jgi:hypothetical protein